jgi:hypothetical protein
MRSILEFSLASARFLEVRPVFQFAGPTRVLSATIAAPTGGEILILNRYTS